MFDDIMHTTENGIVEFWYARELMGCLGYTTWRRFKDAINRAMESCKSAEIEVSDHFADAVKMVEIGSNAVRDVDGGFGDAILQEEVICGFDNSIYLKTGVISRPKNGVLAIVFNAVLGLYLLRG